MRGIEFMLFFIVIVIVIVFFDIRYFAKKNLKKEIIIYSSFAFVTLAFGIAYFLLMDSMDITKLLTTIFGN